jgi:hypothetical protein
MRGGPPLRSRRPHEITALALIAGVVALEALGLPLQPTLRLGAANPPTRRSARSEDLRPAGWSGQAVW